jgi:O-antigen biosynthesis protein
VEKNIKAKLEKLGFVQRGERGVWFPSTSYEFSYSDGDDAENYILTVVSEANDLSVNSNELAQKMIDWPSTYHLSPVRANLLRPFARLFSDKRVLEIGCGCGAISRFLGECGAQVISIEGSHRRAEIARTRCRELDNVEIICNPANMLPDLGKFDFILLIGVLEYSRIYNGKNGEDILLSDCYKRLSQEGKLFVAIENKLGIKYFAGAQEDHIGQPMYGINNSYTDSTVVTFGRKELLAKLDSAGFVDTQEFLPLPDYKLPVTVITPLGWQKYSHDLYQLAVESIHKDHQLGFEHIFSVEQGMMNVWNNNLAADLANSFLMVSAKRKQNTILNNIAAVHYSNDRLAKFSKTVEFVHTKKEGLQIHTFKEKNQNSNSKDIMESVDISDFYQGSSSWLKLTNIVNKPDWQIDQVCEWAKEWIEQLLKSVNLPIILNKNVILPDICMDALPFNIIESSSGKYHFFDQEWSRKDITLGYIVFRGLLHSFLRISSISYSNTTPTIRLVQLIYILLNRMNFDVDEAIFDFYIKQEALFSAKISFDDEYKIYNTIKSINLVCRAQKLININLLRNTQNENLEIIKTLENSLSNFEKDKEQLEKDKEQLEKDKEQLEKDKEQLEKDKEQLEKDKEQLEKAKEQLEKANSIMNTLNITLLKEINLIQSSFSWKATYPLRKFKYYINKIFILK